MAESSVPEPYESDGIIEIDCAQYLSPELRANLRIGKFVPVGRPQQRQGGDATTSSLAGAVVGPREAAIETASALLDGSLASETIAERAIRELTKHFGTAPEDGIFSYPSSGMNHLVQRMHRSRWQWLFERVLLDLYYERSAKDRVAVGGLYGYLTDYTGDRNGAWYLPWVEDRVDTLCRASGRSAVAAALSLWPTTNRGFPGNEDLAKRLAGRALDLLGDGPATAHAVGDLLFYLQDRLEVDRFRRCEVWRPSPAEVSRLVQFLAGAEVEPEGAGRFALGVVTAHPQGVDLSPIVEKLTANDPVMLRCLEWATGWRPGNEQTLADVIACLGRGEGLKAVTALPVSLSDPLQRVAASRDKDGIQPWGPPSRVSAA